MNIAKKKKVQSWSWLCDCEVCSPKCIEQRDRQASWRVTLSAGVKEPPSLSVGWENTKYHRSVCSHVHSCRLVLMRPLVSKCLGKEQPLKLNECHNIKILLNQWHCFQALCAISFSKWWNTLTQGCHHFLWSLWQQPLHSCSQLFFPLIAPAKNSSHCFSMETLFFQRIIVPATATPHFSYSHCFCKWSTQRVATICEWCQPAYSVFWRVALADGLRDWRRLRRLLTTSVEFSFPTVGLGATNSCLKCGVVIYGSFYFSS